MRENILLLTIFLILKNIDSLAIVDMLSQQVKRNENV